MIYDSGKPIQEVSNCWCCRTICKSSRIESDIALIIKQSDIVDFDSDTSNWIENNQVHLRARKFALFLYDISEVVLLSPSPVPAKTSTSDIIKIDNNVVIWFCICCSISSAFLALTSKPKLSLISAWFENIWIHFSLLFFEGASRVPSGWRSRMVFCLWLFTALLITIQVGSYLKSSFAITTYVIIDKYQDAIQRDDIKYWKINFDTRSIECTKEEIRKYLRNCGDLQFNLTACKYIMNIRNEGGRMAVLEATLRELKIKVQSEIEEIRQSGRLFHLGRDKVDSYLFFSGYNTSQFLRENLIQSGLTYLETKPMTYKESQGDAALNSILWQKPTEEGTVLFLEDCTVVFNLWLIGILVSCAVLALEAIVHFTFRTGKPTRYAHRRRIQFLN